MRTERASKSDFNTGSSTKMHVFERILRRACESKTIIGCVNPTPLLERFTLLKTEVGQLRIHHFLRSDEDRELHDHPWAYVSLILAGGYDEQIPVRSVRTMILDPKHGHEAGWTVVETVRVRRHVGQILVRPARWAHRVELAAGKDAWTLIWMMPRSREWGFFRLAGWTPWRRYPSIAACADEAVPIDSRAHSSPPVAVPVMSGSGARSRLLYDREASMKSSESWPCLQGQS